MSGASTSAMRRYDSGGTVSALCLLVRYGTVGFIIMHIRTGAAIRDTGHTSSPSGESLRVNC